MQIKRYPYKNVVVRYPIYGGILSLIVGDVIIVIFIMSATGQFNFLDFFSEFVYASIGFFIFASIPAFLTGSILAKSKTYRSQTARVFWVGFFSTFFCMILMLLLKIRNTGDIYFDEMVFHFVFWTILGGFCSVLVGEKVLPKKR